LGLPLAFLSGLRYADAIRNSGLFTTLTTPGVATMTREQLEQLSPAELIAIILQQQATLLQQQALIEQLQVRIAALWDQVKRLTQPPKDASNSSTPPSQTRKPNRPDRRPKETRT